MTEWKTLDEILPEMGRAAEADPESWFENFEFQSFENYSRTLHKNTALTQDFQYRRKPRTLTYTVERPEPMLGHPELGQKYWVSDMQHPYWSRKYTWSGSCFDLLMFNRGLVYATEKEAVAAAKAMVGGE